MDTPLPPSLSPLVTNHPASSAYRVTMSPHEWVWTHDEQVAMAKALVQRDAEVAKLCSALTASTELMHQVVTPPRNSNAIRRVAFGRVINLHKD